MSRLQDFVNKTKKKLKKKIIKWTTTTVLPFVLVVIIAVASIAAVLSAIVGVFLFIFDPLINAKQYQTEAVYASIRNYGGAYKMYDLSILTNKGLSNDTIKTLFQTEFDSYYAETDKITVPFVTENEYSSFEKQSNPDPDDATTATNITVDWNASSYLYPYRLQWQYILSLASMKCYENEEAFEKVFNQVADNLDDEGHVKESADMELPITTKNIEDAEQSVYDAGLDTKIEYFTNYMPDNYADTIATQSEAKSAITSGFSYSNYCAKAFNASTRRIEMDNYDSAAVNVTMKYSTLPQIQGYDDGNSPGKYAFITKDGYIFPALLVKSASTWLCDYSEFDYEKIKDGNNTKYVLATYKKTYKIEKLVNQWKNYGVDESMIEYLFMMMDMLESNFGGTTSAELKSAYDYYKKNNKEMERVYVNSTYMGYVPSSIEKTDDLEDTYGYELTAKLTDSAGLKKILQTQQNGSNVSPDINIGQIVAQAMYQYNVVYQARVDNDNDSFSQDGYHANAWNDGLWDIEWGGQAHLTEQGSENATKSSRIGLSSAGFINYILRLSIFREDYGHVNVGGEGSVTAKALTSRPTMTQIYRESNYKFRQVNELQPGDIGLLKVDNDNDNENVIGYYVGEAGGMHIFYAINPTGICGSTGSVRKICLKGETGNSGISECDLTYFCRYYYGANGKVVNQYKKGVKKKIYDRYNTIRGAFATFEAETHKNHIDYQNDFINAVMEEPGKYGCGDYAEVLILKHISGGIMPEGVGDDEDIGTYDAALGLNASTYDLLYDNSLLIWPLDDLNEESSEWITSWFGYRDIFTGSGFHSGLDIGAAYFEPVYAAADGEITIAVSGCYGYNTANDSTHWSEGGGYGNHVEIDHGDNVRTLYGHLIALADGISVGVNVTQGQLIGYVGSSGQSSGAHLHFEVRDGDIHTGYSGMGHSEGATRPEYNHNVQVDPFQFFPEYAGTSKVIDSIYKNRPNWFQPDIDINNSY